MSATVRPVVLPRGEPGVVMQRRDCAQLFILYAGRTQRVLVHPYEFLRQAGIVGRNLAIVRDLSNCCYQRGVSKSVDTVEKFLAWQRKLVASLSHVREVYCVGSSAGAYAALLSGHYLGAQRVWAFAPPVPVLVSERTPYVDPEYSDVSAILARAGGRTRYDVYFNESVVEDRRAAERLAALPNVFIHPQAGEGHIVLDHMMNQRSLVGMFPPFVRA